MVRMDGKTSSSSPPLSLIFSEKMCLGPSEGTEKGRGSTVFRGTPRCVLCFRGFPWDPWGSLTQLAKSLLTAGQWRVVAGIQAYLATRFPLQLLGELLGFRVQDRKCIQWAASLAWG